MLCLGLGSPADDFAAELLARVLRQRKLDARHFSLEDLNDPQPAGATTDPVGLAYLVSTFATEERDRRDAVAQQVHQRFPTASVVMVLLAGMSSQTDPIRQADDTGRTVTSFVEAERICLEWQKVPPNA
jgi:hypothetical protein